MKIYSWNVYCWNRKPEEVKAYINSLDFDVLCLQEVTDELLVYLKTLPYHIAYNVDVIRLLSPKKEVMNYVVVLTKHEIIHRRTFQYPDLGYPLHTRAFIKMMSVFKWSWVTERGGVYADIRVNGHTVRVFSVHLTVWTPGYREREFAIVMRNAGITHPVIVCGDFNIFDAPLIKIYNLFLGAPFAQGMPWYPERALFEGRFRKHGLVNPLKGQMTHRVSRSQLDHILVSHELRVTDMAVEADTHGSDHNPIWITLAYPD
jgi:endonuclease/exonuclease/phosphatase family metal-dependent hydrolase